MKNKFKIFKFLLLTPFFISIPFLNNSKVNAGLEFQWDQDSGYRRLKWLQKDGESRARNTIFFFLRPTDRRADLLKITMTIPKRFKSTIKEEKISLCKVKIGGYDTRTKCITEIPADFELKEDNTSLDIFPYNPIPSNKDSYAIVFKVFNPKRTGLYQFHSYGQYFGKDTVSSYLGSSTIVID
ncbi:conserved hypothetical protein [Prochlorococcus marinus str. MIT 9515]|uniref:DUF2808 domain-containing protein n=1 Tax=Prochlorococcus marinus (strain MIT 9515) TaxID=167542 RepID=A2BXQ0_PROM5|nr:DUF2808 domain-containing protein [Prochlorococcus marinus]ABM72561.1 conserved hypothetical protein [Prochlorococcus marinus str. MIT 9515]